MILDTEEQSDGPQFARKLEKLKGKVSVERQKRNNAMLRLNNSVAGFLLKQSIDKGKRNSSLQSEESTERNIKKKLNPASKSR